MKRINIASPEFAFDPEDPEGYRGGMVRPGPDFGARITGTSAYELPPGQALCPYHYEWGEEEWLLVLEGTPTLRDPEGEHELSPMDLVFFAVGPEGAHKVENQTNEPVRFVMFSNLVWPTSTIYPDSDKVGVWTDMEKTDSIVLKRDAVDYYDGEMGE